MGYPIQTLTIQSKTTCPPQGWPVLACWPDCLTNLIHYSSIIIHSDGSALSHQQLWLLALESVFCDVVLGGVLWCVLCSLLFDRFNLS